MNKWPVSFNVTLNVELGIGLIDFWVCVCIYTTIQKLQFTLRYIYNLIVQCQFAEMIVRIFLSKWTTIALNSDFNQLITGNYINQVTACKFNNQIWWIDFMNSVHNLHQSICFEAPTHIRYNAWNYFWNLCVTV